MGIHDGMVLSRFGIAAYVFGPNASGYVASEPAIDIASASPIRGRHSKGIIPSFATAFLYDISFRTQPSIGFIAKQGEEVSPARSLFEGPRVFRLM